MLFINYIQIYEKLLILFLIKKIGNFNDLTNLRTFIIKSTNLFSILSGTFADLSMRFVTNELL